MSLHTVSNQVFRFLQTSANVITTTDTTGNTNQDITEPTIIDSATHDVLKNFIDNTAVLTAVGPSTATVSEQELLSDLQNYVKTTGSNITGILNFEGDYAYITFPDDSKQVTGYTNLKDNILLSVNNQTQYITSDGIGKTYIPILNVDGQLNINDSGLAISKISNLQSTIDGFNSTFTTHTDQITEINNTLPIIKTNVSISQNDILNLQAADRLLQSQITNNINNINLNTNNISVLDTARSIIETVNAVQDRDISELQTHIGYLQNQADTSSFNIASNTTNITQNSSNISNLQNDVQSINSHLLMIDTIDLNLQTKITENNINTLTKFSQIDNNILINSNNIQNCNQNILNNTNDITTINNEIAIIDQSITDIQATDMLLQAQINNNKTSIDNINIVVEILPVHSNQILSLENAGILYASEIANIVNTTQPNINAFNRLNVSYLADGSINNIELQTLAGIDTTQTIQHQIDGVKASVSTLSGLENIDLSSIQNLQGNITTIQTALAQLNSTDNTQATFNNNIQNQVSQNTTSITNLNNWNTTQNTLNIDLQNQITTNLNNTNFSITGLNTSLNSVIANEVSVINNSIAALQVSDSQILSNVNSQITGINHSISTIQAMDTSQNNSITSLNNLITNNETSTEIQFNNINELIVAAQANVNSNTTDIINLKQQNVIQESINNTNSNSISSNTSGLNTITTVNIPTIYSNIANNTTNIINLTNTANIQNATNTNTQAQITAAANSITALQGRLTADEANISNSSSLITGLSTGLQTANNNISTISGKLATDETNIANLQTANSVNAAIISLKQNIINISNKLLSSNVDYSTSPLQYIDIGSPLQATLTNINNTLAGNSTNLTTINTNLNVLNNADIQHTNLIETLNNNIMTINSTKQNNINSTNLLDSKLVFIDSLTSPLSDVITLFDAELAILNSNKQSNINSSNKLLSYYVDYTASPLQYVDINSSLNTTLTGITNSISTLQGLQAGDMNSFADIDHNFDVVDASIATKQNIISAVNLLDTSFLGNGTMSNTKFDYLKNINMDVQAQINSLTSGLSSVAPSVSYDPLTQITTIVNTTHLNALTFPDSSVQNTGYTSAKDGELILSKTKLTNISYDSVLGTTIINPVYINNLQGTTINTINSNIASKQNQINSSNKLLSSNVDYESSPLQYIDITSGLSSTLAGINSNISSLQQYDQSQINKNTGFSNDIMTLYSTKQNSISSANKIDASNIGFGSITNIVLDYLKNVSSDIQGQFNTLTTNQNGFASSSTITALNNNISSIQAKQISDEENIISINNLIMATNLTSTIDFNVILGSIGSNTETCQDLTSYINDLMTSRTNNEANIATLTWNQQNDEANITTLQNSLTSDEAIITSHTLFINTINTNITSLFNSRTIDEVNINSLLQSRISDEASIGTINTNIASLQTSKTSVEANISSAQTDIVSLKASRVTDEATLATQTTSINSINTSITSLNNSRTTDEANIATAQADITSLKASRTTDEANIATAQTDITSLKASRTTDEATIASHTTSIGTINTTLTTMPTLAGTNTFTNTNTFTKGIIGPAASISYTVGMIGYTAQVFGDKANFAITTNQIVTPNNTATSIGIGVYIVCMYINSQPSNNTGTVNFLTTGLSTSASAYVGGIPAISTMGTFSLPATVNSRITGGITYPLTVTTAQSYFLLMNCSFTGAMTLQLLSTACYFTYTRVA